MHLQYITMRTLPHCLIFQFPVSNCTVSRSELEPKAVEMNPWLTDSILKPLMLPGEWNPIDLKKDDFCDEENVFNIDELFI